VNWVKTEKNLCAFQKLEFYQIGQEENCYKILINTL